MAALAALFVGCTPIPKTVPAPLRPPESAAMAPLATQAQAAALSSRETAAKLEAEVGTIQKTTAGLRQGINQATAEADRLRQQKSATEKELETLWGMLTAEQTRAAELWNHVETSKSLANQHREQRLIAEKRLGELADAVIAAEMEIAALRQNHDQLSAQVDQARRTEAALGEKLSKAENDAAIARFFKAAAAIGVAILVIGTILVVALKIRPF